MVSVRLNPGHARLDLWSRDCWRAEREGHVARVQLMGSLAQRLSAVPGARALIVGGDSNASGGDAVFRPLHARLQDSFPAARREWGEAMMNDLPIVRFDRVSVGGGLRAASVVARRTRHSDHRLVVCDLLLPRRKSGM